MFRSPSYTDSLIEVTQRRGPRDHITKWCSCTWSWNIWDTGRNKIWGIQIETSRKKQSWNDIARTIYLQKSLLNFILYMWKNFNKGFPWTEEPGRLQSMGSLRVGHDWATSLSLFTFMHWRRKWQPTPVFLPGESQGQGSLVGCSLWGRTESDTTEVT